MKMTLPNVRLSFASIDKPSNQFGGDLKYSASFIVDPATVDGKTTLDLFRKNIRQIESDELGGMEMHIDKLPMRDGNEKEYDGWKDKMIIKATSKTPVKVLNRDKQLISPEHEQYPYPGCYVDAVISLWAMKSPQYGNRICAGLVAVRFRKDGEPFSGASLDVDSDLPDLPDEDAA